MNKTNKTFGGNYFLSFVKTLVVKEYTLKTETWVLFRRSSATWQKHLNTAYRDNNASWEIYTARFRSSDGKTYFSVLHRLHLNRFSSFVHWVTTVTTHQRLSLPDWPLLRGRQKISLKQAVAEQKRSIRSLKHLNRELWKVSSVTDVKFLCRRSVLCWRYEDLKWGFLFWRAEMKYNGCQSGPGRGSLCARWGF